MDRDIKIVLTFTASMILLISTLVFTAVFFKAKSYNEMTCSDVTWWEAFNIELRVTDGVSRCTND